MLVKIEGKQKVLDELERVQRLISELQNTLWSLPHQIKLVVSDEEVKDIIDSEPDNQ